MNIFVPETVGDLFADLDLHEKRLSPRLEQPLHTLPLHLAANVLVELGDIKDVPAALLSSPIFYEAYRQFPALTREILRAELPDDECYVLALIAHESHSARRARREDMDARSFVSLIRDDPYHIVAAHRGMRLVEALRIGDLHGAVVGLRDMFARATLAPLYGLDPVEDKEELEEKVRGLSTEEVRRIERALYRFQVYCNLFSFVYRKGGDDVESKRIFYDQYSSWVNEQLGCVHDFLEVLLAREIDAVVAAKGSDAPFLENGKQRRKQHYLSLGLTLIWDVIAAPSIDAKHAVLRDATAKILNRATPPSPSFAQNEWKYREPESPSAWGINIKALTRESDANPGPRALWEETHATQGVKDMFFFADNEAALRRLGYVMWDRERTEREEVRGQIEAAKSDASPTFMSPARLMNPARSWDKQFRPPVVPSHRISPRAARLTEGLNRRTAPVAQ